MPRLDPFESLALHCDLTLKAFIGTLQGKLKGTGVSPAQFVALAHLIGLGPLSQSALAERLHITRATMVRLVDRMERDGWVIRQSHSEDARLKRVVPTKKAAKVWEEVSQASRELLDQAYRGVSPAEIETVKRVLERVRRNLGG